MLPKYPYTLVSLSLIQWKRNVFLSTYMTPCFEEPAYCSVVCSITKSCSTLWNSMACSLPRSSVHRIFQAGIPQWVAISYSRDQLWIKPRSLASSALIDGFFSTAPPGKPSFLNTIKIQILTSLSLPSPVFLELLFNLTSHVCEHALVERAATVRVKSNSLGNTEKKQGTRSFLVPRMTSYWKNLWLSLLKSEKYDM